LSVQMGAQEEKQEGRHKVECRRKSFFSHSPKF
jgi:hypothetical protein